MRLRLICATACCCVLLLLCNEGVRSVDTGMDTLAQVNAQGEQPLDQVIRSVDEGMDLRAHVKTQQAEPLYEDIRTVDAGLDMLAYWKMVERKTATVSSNGLPNCFCKGCHPSTTVGKIYNDHCYFISNFHSYRVQTNMDNRNEEVLNRFRVANVTDVRLATVLMQVTSEMYILEMLKRRKSLQSQPYKLSVAFYTSTAEYLSSLSPEQSVRDIPDTCPTLWIGGGQIEITSDCQQSHLALLVADRGQYTSMHQADSFAFDRCHFDADSLSYSADQCVSIADAEQTCPLMSLNNMDDLESVHSLLIARTRENFTDLRPYSTYFQVEHFNERLVNTRYSLILNGGGKSQCTFIDVHGKRVLHDECTKPHHNLCLVERDSTAGPADNQTTSSEDDEAGQSYTWRRSSNESTEFAAVMDEVAGQWFTRMDLNVSSSFGLQNCFCATCDPHNTVGKIYDGRCYYITTSRGHRFKSTEKNTYRQVRMRYQPAIIDRPEIGTVFKQVSNEFYLKHVESEFGIFSDDSPRFYIKPSSTAYAANKCYVYDAETSTIFKDCSRPYLVFMCANRTAYYALPVHRAEPYEQCSFDPSAMAMVGRSKYCIKESEDECEYREATVYPRNFENLQRYLVNVSQPNAANLTGAKYRVAGFKLKSFTQLDYNVRPAKKTVKCWFIDVQSKQVNPLACRASSKKLCEIKRPPAASPSSVTPLPVSRYGLRNCICDGCQPDTTVGKLYSGKCYFASIDSQYRFEPTAYNFNSSSPSRYSTAVISDVARIRVLQQLAFEMWKAHDEQQIAFYVAGDFNISGAFVPAPQGVPHKCLVYDEYSNMLFQDCGRVYSVFLVANETNSTVYDEYAIRHYRTCSFDSEAIPISDNYCLKLSDAPCDKLADQMFDVSVILGTGLVKEYLIAKTQPHADQLGYLNLTIRVDGVNVDTHSKFCTYYDMQSKLRFDERCDLPAKLNLCAIGNKFAVMPTTASVLVQSLEEDNSSTTTRTEVTSSQATTPTDTTTTSYTFATEAAAADLIDGETEFMMYIGGISVLFLVLLLALYYVIKFRVRHIERSQI
jgi:hypothetical protein